MSFKRFLFADAGLSVLLHALKALVAFFVNWLVLRYFPVRDFVAWSVTSSLLIIATASDLGIGQYITTRMINSPMAEWAAHIRRGVSALLPLAMAAGLFVFVALSDAPPFYRAAMAVLLAGRLIVIPYIAVLHAKNQFKVRKAIELAAYVLAAALVGGVALARADVRLALLVLNLTFLLGALLMAVVAGRYAPLKGALRLASPSEWLEVYRAAIPFMANNLAGLLTYGGFIWLSSLVLTRDDVAKLAVLHSFVLVNAYQFYDVFLKARQADLVDPARLPPYRVLNMVLMLALPPLFLLFGREAVALIDDRIALARLEAALFGLLMALELGNLFAQAVTQVDFALARRLNGYALLKSLSVASFVLVAALPLLSGQRLPWLLALLTAGSAIALIYLMVPLRSAPRRQVVSADIH